jgi:hypothetical protein
LAVGRNDFQSSIENCQLKIAFTDSRLPCYTALIETPFSPEQEKRLSQVASQEGTDTEHLVRDAALRLLEDNANFRAAVREASSKPIVASSLKKRWTHASRECSNAGAFAGCPLLQTI